MPRNQDSSICLKHPLNYRNMVTLFFMAESWLDEEKIKEIIQAKWKVVDIQGIRLDKDGFVVTIESMCGVQHEAIARMFNDKGIAVLSRNAMVGDLRGL